MAIGEKIKGLFRRFGSRDLETDEGRARAIRQAWDDARRLLTTQTSKSDQDAVLRPIEDLVGLFREAGRDELEVWRALHRLDVEDPFWRKQLIRHVGVLARVPAEDLHALEAQARFEARNLGLWRRLLTDTAALTDEMRVLKCRESLVLTLRRFFPADAESTWFDVESEPEALRLYEENLETVAKSIIDGQRSDRTGLSILETASNYFPHNLFYRSGYARLLSRSGAKDSKSLTMMLEALAESPDDPELMRNAGVILGHRRGHEEEGFEMLRQVHEQGRGDDELLGEMVEIARRIPSPREEHLEFVRLWIDKFPYDEETVVWLADTYIRAKADTPHALDAMRKAAHFEDVRNAGSEQETHRYRLALGRLLAAKDDHQGVVDSMQPLLQDGDTAAEVVVPLARAYAHFERIDRLAVTAYQCALDQGLKDTRVRDQICHYLFKNGSDDANAVAHFRAALANGGSKWAELGIMQEDIRNGKAAECLEKVAALLQSGNEEPGLVRLAAAALAEAPQRAQLRRVMGLHPKVSLAIFEKAAELQPDALLILTTLARYRLSSSQRTEETAKLLGEICRRDPEELELRIARADIMFELGQGPVARQLYQEILGRMGNGASQHSMIRISVDEVDRIEARVLDLLAVDPNPPRDELARLAESGMDPDAPAKRVVRIAELLAKHDFDHPIRAALMDRASALDPSNELIEVAVAVGRARRGNPRPALQLSLRHLRQRRYDWTISLLHEAQIVMRPEHVTRDLRQHFLEIAFAHATLPDDLLAEIARVLVRGGVQDPGLVRLYEKAIALHPDDPLIQEGILQWDRLMDSRTIQKID